jgi:predicted nucleic acid-binding Zn ribbon protein
MDDKIFSDRCVVVLGKKKKKMLGAPIFFFGFPCF